VQQSVLVGLGVGKVQVGPNAVVVVVVVVAKIHMQTRMGRRDGENMEITGHSVREGQAF